MQQPQNFNNYQKVIEAAERKMAKDLNENTGAFVRITEEMQQTYAKKNQDYGNSFEQGFNHIGPAYAVGRMLDKYNRIENLLLRENSLALVEDESVLDTLTDLASYCVMTRMAIEKQIIARKQSNN